MSRKFYTFMLVLSAASVVLLLLAFNIDTSSKKDIVITERSYADEPASSSLTAAETTEIVYLDINEAGVDEFKQLEGIGEKLAENIVSFREENDGFSNIEEIMHVPGIGKGIFDKIKSSIYVREPVYPTVTENDTTAEKTEEPLYIDINTAEAEKLAELSGIGEKLSAEIVDYREANGGFRNIEELMLVPGIGEGIFDKIKASIYVREPVYFQEAEEQTEAVQDHQQEEVTEPKLEDPGLKLEDHIPININTADKEILILLPYVDDHIADRIIEIES